MGSRQQVILKVCGLLAQQENLRVTVKESAKGAGIIGLGALVGGLIGGKTGLLAGAALGGAASMAIVPDYKSVVDIINEDMTDRQREELVEAVNDLFRGNQLTDAVAVLTIVSQNESLKASIVRGIMSYVQEEVSSSILR